MTFFSENTELVTIYFTFDEGYTSCQVSYCDVLVNSSTTTSQKHTHITLTLDLIGQLIRIEYSLMTSEEKNKHHINFTSLLYVPGRVTI